MTAHVHPQSWLLTCLRKGHEWEFLLETSKFENNFWRRSVLLLLGWIQMIPILRTVDIPLNQMNPRLRLNNGADLPRLQCKRGVFKFLLHFAAAEEAPRKYGEKRVRK